MTHGFSGENSTRRRTARGENAEKQEIVGRVRLLTWPDLAILGYMATEVKITELKNHLSRYLRSVRKGHEIVVKDRETPIARVVPYKERRERLEVIPPTRSLKEVEEIILRRRRPPRVSLADLEQALKEERRDRFDDLLK